MCVSSEKIHTCDSFGVEGLEQLLPQHYDDSNLPVGSALDAGMGEFKLLGMTFVPYRSLEDRYYAKFQRPFLIEGSSVLVPTLEPARLVSLLVSSRALKTDSADSTLVERAIVFLLMGGWMHPTLRRVGENVLYASSTKIARDADVLHSIEKEREMAMHLFVNNPSLSQIVSCGVWAHAGRLLSGRGSSKGEYLVIKCFFNHGCTYYPLFIPFFKGEEVASLKISIPVAITNGLLMPHMLFC